MFVCSNCLIMIWLSGSVLWTVGIRYAECPSGSPGHGGGLGSSPIEMEPWMFLMTCQWIMAAAKIYICFVWIFVSLCIETPSGREIWWPGYYAIVYLRCPDMALLFEWLMKHEQLLSRLIMIHSFPTAMILCFSWFHPHFCLLQLTFRSKLCCHLDWLHEKCWVASVSLSNCLCGTGSPSII